MLLSALDAKNPAYDAETWADNEALYRGGKSARARFDRFLPKNPSEPTETYALRLKESAYKSYVGSVVDYYVAWLFSASFDVRARDAVTGEPVAKLDDFYAKWKEDVGGDVDLIDFLRDRLRVALTQECSHWLVEFPGDGGAPPSDRAEYEARELGNARLCPVERSQLYDWECDDHDELLWVIVHDMRYIRPDPRQERDQIVETWRIYDATDVETFELRYESGKRPPPKTDVASLGKRKHGAVQVPIVTLRLPDGLCVVERTKDAQLEHFRLSNALTWGIKRTCYAMPVFKLKDEQSPPVMGTGYYIQLGAEDSADWMAPPTDHLSATALAADAARDEIYRIAHQMALSVNNRMAAAVSRSGESKEQDALATRVMLNVFGAAIKEAIEETYEILSDGRGDVEVAFSVEGLDAFDTESVSVLLANVGTAQGLGIPSKTFEKEIKIRAALGMVPDADQSVKDAIREEIDEGVDNPPEPMDPMAALHDAAEQAAEQMTNGTGQRPPSRGQSQGTAQVRGNGGRPAVPAPPQS